MRLALAAYLALLGAPAFAAGASAIHVGLTVTGDFSPSLAGSWQSEAAADGTIYHFVVRGSSGTLHQKVSVPVRGTRMCDLRLSGVIYSLQAMAGRGARYEMRYAIRSADVIMSPTNSEDCKDVADAYWNDIPTAGMPQSLILSRAGDGRLIDRATGAEYIRTR